MIIGDGFCLVFQPRLMFGGEAFNIANELDGFLFDAHGQTVEVAKVDCNYTPASCPSRNASAGEGCKRTAFSKRNQPQLADAAGWTVFPISPGAPGRVLAMLQQRFSQCRKAGHVHKQCSGLELAARTPRSGVACV